MTRIAPEPTDRAVARVYAGGLPDAPLDIAKALADLLNRALDSGLAVVPYTDPGETHYEVVYSVEGARDHACAEVEYDTADGSWHATADPAR